MAVTNICKYSFYLKLTKVAVGFNSRRYIRLSLPSKVSPVRYGNLALIAAGLGAGALLGGGWSVYNQTQTHPPIMNDDTTNTSPPILKELPDVPIARRIISPTDNSNLKLVLFQYPTCPFCCKVRAFLDYYGFSYDVVEVDPVLRQQTKWSTYKKVPILLASVEDGYQQLNDSTMIISVLKSFLNDRDTSSLSELTKFYPDMKFHDEHGDTKVEIMNKYFLMYQNVLPKGRSNETIVSERKWRKWADDVLVHTLSPNVYRSREEALQAFNWFSEVGEWDRLFPSWERNIIVYMGALAMWGISRRLKKKYQLKDDVRQSLYDESNTWLREVKQHGQYHGGTSPDLADLAVYGVLSSIEGCVAFQDLVNNTKIGTWYNDVKLAVKTHRGSVEMSSQ